MRIFFIIFGLIIFAAADNFIYDFSKNDCLLHDDSLVSITDFGADPANDDNTDAFRDALKVGDNILIPKGDSAYKIQGKLLIPGGKIFTFEQGGIIDVAGIIIGYDTFIKAGNFQIFTLNSRFSGTFQTDTLFCDWMGTKGDGIADDFDAMNSFFNLIDNFQVDYLKFGKNKKYYFKRGIEYQIDKTFFLDGNGSTMIRNYKDISENDNNVLKFEGKKILNKGLFKDLKKGSDIIELDNTIGLEEGMGLIIFSKELYGNERMADKPDGSEYYHYHYKGFMSKIIKIIDQSKILVADTIPYNYNAQKIRFVDFYKIVPVTIKNLNFSMENVSGNIKAYELKLANLFNIEVNSCKFIPNGYSAITAKAIYNSLFRGIYIEAPKSGGNNKILGVYGIVPSLNVNVTYDSIYVRAMTHGIAFTDEPSFGVKVKNSNFKSVILESNGFDSHASFSIKIENSEIWGAQGNWGTFEFVNCKLHNPVDGNNLWQERASGSDGKLNVIIKDCDISFVTKEISTIFYENLPKDSSNVYQLINCKVHLLDNPNAYTYMINRIKEVNTNAKIKPVTIEGCSFYGSAKLYFPRKSKDTVTCASRGTFTFKNNTYNNLFLFQPNDQLFGEWLIEGNKPNNLKSNFHIDIENADANFQFNFNELVGDEFFIKNNKGSFEMKQNKIETGKTSAKQNIFSENQNSVFQKNVYPPGIQVIISGTK